MLYESWIARSWTEVVRWECVNRVKVSFCLANVYDPVFLWPTNRVDVKPSEKGQMLIDMEADEGFQAVVETNRVD
jgi:hypothetical protein